MKCQEFLQGCLNLKGGAQKMDIMHMTIMNRKMMMGLVTTMAAVSAGRGSVPTVA